MSDLQFDSDSQNSSGKPGGNQSPTALILFGVPFFLVGIIALAAAVHDPKQKNVSVAFAVGGIFICVGLGIIVAGFRLRKKARLTADLQAQHPNKPWLWRADWAEGKIKSSALAQPVLMLIMGLAFCGIGGVSTFFGLPEVWQKHNYAALLVLFFPLAGLGMLAAFFVAWRSRKRFGKCFFELAQTPIPLGGILEGMIQTGKPLKLEHELNLKISCVRQVTTGSGKSRSTDEYILWQDEKIYSSHANLPEPEPGHTGIPVHFKLADGQPQCFTRGNVSVFWRLETKSKMRGPDFHAIFDLPVFKTADATIADTDADENDPTAALQAPIEEIRRDENSKIKITDGAHGREFYFPAARNPGTALLTTLASIVCTGIAAGTFHLGFHSGVMILFPIIFGLIGVLTFFGALSLWFKSSRITVDSTNIRATNRWLIFSRKRDFSAGDYARFATKTGMQSGSTIFTDIKLVRAGADAEFAQDTKKFQNAGQVQDARQVNQFVAERFRQAAGPSGVTVATSIANSAEAEWLVNEMNKTLGRK